MSCSELSCHRKGWENIKTYTASPEKIFFVMEGISLAKLKRTKKFVFLLEDFSVRMSFRFPAGTSSQRSRNSTLG